MRLDQTEGGGEGTGGEGMRLAGLGREGGLGLDGAGVRLLGPYSQLLCPLLTSYSCLVGDYVYPVRDLR